MVDRRTNIFTISDVEELGVAKVSARTRAPHPRRTHRPITLSPHSLLPLAPALSQVAEMALAKAWEGCDAVYLSWDIDSIEAACVPGTGWPEIGGLLPREALKLVGLIAAEGLCGMEVVEVSPPYDHADITSLMAMRLMVDTMGSLVAHGKMGAHKHIIDKPFVPF